MPSGSAAQSRQRRPFGMGAVEQFLFLVVDDLEKKHPAKLRNALRVDVDVLSHDVLNGLDDFPDRHAYTASL